MRRIRSADATPDARTVRVCLHGDLVELLRGERRARPLEVRVADGATIKHLIETLDVPHTEIGEVAVDGQLSGLDTVLAAGERVDAYPAGGDPVGTSPARFLADAHLGALARLLRLVGFDTVLAADGADSELAARAAAESRIVLSRDRELLKHRKILRGRLIRSLQPEDQLAEVLARFALKDALRPFTRCLECNAPLEAVERSRVEDRLPPGVAASQVSFTRCVGCARVYWPGSHWQKLHARVGAIRARLE